MTLNKSVLNLSVATGIILLAKPKAEKETIIIKKMSGRIIRNRPMPLDFIAVSSKCSERFPKVMMLERTIETGNARFTSGAEA